MPETRVIAIDPAPAKPSTVFDGVRYARLAATELRDRVNLIATEGAATLVCWDAPLTGPTDLDHAGSGPYDFTKRAIERFFSLKKTGFKTPKGISVLGYGACPHWTITRSMLGLPRVGTFDALESDLPFSLVTQPADLDPHRPSIVEVHPALAAWLWCRHERDDGANWLYKGDRQTECKVRIEMWEIIRERTGVADDLPCPVTDDDFDAAIGYILGTMFVRDLASPSRRCTILGNARDGAFLVPCEPQLIAAWDLWRPALQMHNPILTDQP